MKQDYTRLNSVVEKAMLGDKRAFEKLCLLKGQDVLYLCNKYMNNRQDSEDAAQEVFIQMQRSLPKLQSAQAFTVWLQRIVLNTCSKMRRKQMGPTTQTAGEDALAELPATSLEMLPEAYVQNEELKNELLEMITSLPQGMRSCILLYYYEGMKVAEIAEVLDSSEAAVNMQLSRARLKIFTAIKKRTPDAYQQTLMPMSMLGVLLRVDAQSVIPAAQVGTCLAGMGIGTGGNLPGKRSMPKVVTLVAVTGVAALAAALVYLAVSAPAPQAQLPGGASGAEVLQMTPPSLIIPTGSSAGMPKWEDEALPPGEQHPAASQPLSETDMAVPLPPQGDPAPLVATPVSGTVQLKDNQGRVIPAGMLLEGVQLAVTDGFGRELTRTGLAEDGGYLFAGLAIAQAGAYTVQLHLPPDAPLAATDDNPQGAVALQLTPGQAMDGVAMYVKLSVSPDGSVRFEGGDCDCGHVNPSRAIILDTSVLNATQQWQILRDADGAVLYTGSGGVITAELQELRDQGADGVYTIFFIHTNEAGNRAQIKRDFVIDSGSIYPNQYA